MFTGGVHSYYGGDVSVGEFPGMHAPVNGHRHFRQPPAAALKMMLCSDPLSPLESMYMDDQLRFYEQEDTKPGIAYCDLQPINFEAPDQVPPTVPQQVESPNQRPISFEDLPDLGADRSWQYKPPELWHTSDVLDWLFHWLAQHRVDLLDVNTLGFNNITGQDLCRMSRNEFCSIDPQYGGAIYDSLQYLLVQYRATPPAPVPQDIPPPPIRQEHDVGEWTRERCARWSTMVDLDAQGPSPYSGCESDRESASSSMSTVNERKDSTALYMESNRIIPKLEPIGLPCMKKGGRRGRPPKKDGKSRNKQGKGTGKLWEFIRDLLLNPATNPSLIRWERREDGIFKFVQSDKVARLWGDRKQNPRMTYEKLSRAMRYYYKSQVLLPVFGRRLVYKFGPNATGWRPVHHQPPQAM